MILTKEQVEQVLPACELPTSQKVIDYCLKSYGADWSKKQVYLVGQLPMLSKEKILEGIDLNAIQIHYENRQIYVQASCNITYEFNKNGEKIRKVDSSKFNAWMNTLDENKSSGIQKYIRDKDFEMRQFQELVGEFGQIGLS